MAVSKNRDDDYSTTPGWDLPLPERDSANGPRLTSIVARTVLTLSVSMSTSEMDTLINSFGKAVHDLTEQERAVQGEFIEAVRAIQ